MPGTRRRKHPSKQEGIGVPAGLWGLARRRNSRTLRKRAPAVPATGERFLRLRKSDLFLAALLAAGAATFVYALFRRKKAAGPFPYARPEGGEREGEFELFIGS